MIFRATVIAFAVASPTAADVTRAECLALLIEAENQRTTVADAYAAMMRRFDQTVDEDEGHPLGWSIAKLHVLQGESKDGWDAFVAELSDACRAKI